MEQRFTIDEEEEDPISIADTSSSHHVKKIPRVEHFYRKVT
jgi:hypothetical protein